jgi:hypothetical protein
MAKYRNYDISLLAKKLDEIKSFEKRSFQDFELLMGDQNFMN